MSHTVNTQILIMTGYGENVISLLPYQTTSITQYTTTESTNTVHKQIKIVLPVCKVKLNKTANNRSDPRFDRSG